MNERAILAVHPPRAVEALPRLIAALEAGFPIDVVPCAPNVPHDAVVAFDPDDATLAALCETGTPVLAFTTPPDGSHRAVAELTAAESVDRRLRGIVLPPQAVAEQPAGEGEQVLARAAGRAVWCVGAGAQSQRVASTPHELVGDETLKEAIHSDRGLAIIALVTLARGLTATRDFDAPPLRAAMLFDDPNLRRASYGFINYSELIHHADAHGYHASMAMIPIDGRFTSRAAVTMFRDRPDRVSLTFHGNNHEKRELLRPAKMADALALCAQALRRVERFEAGSGLSVDRVMTAPHGLCSRPSARALGALGFDALCAIHPYPWLERAPADRPLAGWEPATLVDGCPVIPRIPLDWGASGIALHAFLDQPIVMYGHHDDLAVGLEPLARAADAVNRLGDVRWCALGDIATSNHRVRIEGTRATIRMYANRALVALPADIEELVVVTPGDSAVGYGGWSAGPRPAAVAAIGEGTPRPPTATVEVRLHSRWATTPACVAERRASVWPIVRRIGTELRDRTAPLRARRRA